MNATAKLFGTTYTIVTDEFGDLALEGPRGGYYILVPIVGRTDVYTMRSLRSGDKKVKGNTAYIANLGGELVEAGTGDIRIDAPIVEFAEAQEDTEVLTDEDFAALNSMGAEMDGEGEGFSAEIEAHLAATWALRELKAQTLAWIQSGMNPDDAYRMATVDVVGRDKRAAITLAFYEQSGRLAELDAA